MRKSRRELTLLLMPFAIFLWFIGWLFYWIGQKSGKSTLVSTSHAEAENVAVTVLLTEPKIEA